MTKTDVLKWCDKGNHEFVIRDILKSVRDVSDITLYMFHECNNCPATMVRKL